MIDQFEFTTAEAFRSPPGRRLRIRAAICLLLAVIAAILPGCLPAAETPTVLPPTETPTLVPSPSPSPTVTIDWFPATDTPPPSPLPAVTQTSEIFPPLGEVLLEDLFDDPSIWERTSGPRGSATLGLNELSIVLNEPGAYISSTRLGPYLTDFYLEVTALANLCAGQDEYGVLLRAASAADFYRFSLSCDGQMRLDRIRGGAAASPLPWMPSAAIPRNAPATTRIGAWADGEQMHFFINGTYQVTVKTPLIPGGNIGLFARSGGENAVTVNYSELKVWDVLP